MAAKAPTPTKISMPRQTKLKKPNVHFQIDSHKETLREELKRSPLISLKELEERLVPLFCTQYNEDKTRPASAECDSVYQVKNMRANVHVICKKAGCKFGIQFNRERGDDQLRYNQKSSVWTHTIERHSAVSEKESISVDEA